MTERNNPTPLDSDGLPEVQYERLRPQQIAAVREARPIAYIPIGTLEWHGFHNPVGLDTLKAHALCVRCAQANGGLVFPPLWYGENREQGLMEANAPDRAKIADGYGLPAENFDPGYMGRSVADQDVMYHQLLLHLLHQVSSLGFKIAAICAGHYPLIDHARSACHIYHQQASHTPPARRLLPWAFSGYELVRDLFPYSGDHAAYWETSLLMALDDDGMVDLAVLPDDPAELVGVGGPRPAREANAEAGQKYVKAIVERVGEKIRERLDRHEEYTIHNLPF